MAYRYVQDVFPLVSSGLCRYGSRSAGSSRVLAELAQELAEVRPLWQLGVPSVAQLYRRAAARSSFGSGLGRMSRVLREMVRPVPPFRLAAVVACPRYQYKAQRCCEHQN